MPHSGDVFTTIAPWQRHRKLGGDHVAQRIAPMKDRLNCVNALLRNQAGEHRLLVGPRCKELIRDFEQVCWKTDPYGNPLAELDKSDPLLLQSA